MRYVCQCGSTHAGGTPCPRSNRRRELKTRAHGRSTQAWKRLRARRLSIARGVCELRLEGCTVKATTVHLDPRMQGDHGAATVDDLRAACLHCHGVVDGSRARSAA